MRTQPILLASVLALLVPSIASAAEDTGTVELSAHADAVESAPRTGQRHHQPTTASIGNRSRTRSRWSRAS